MDSIWSQTADLPSFPQLEGNLKTDALVVGGGMAGLLCAYWLDRAGVNCALVEADRLCGGVTENTTAKLTFQHGLIYARLLREFGLERTRLYLEAGRAALKRFRELCRDMDCDLRSETPMSTPWTAGASWTGSWRRWSAWASRRNSPGRRPCPCPRRGR